MTYDEALAKREQWARGAVAEYAGFVDAKIYGRAVRQYLDLYEQKRYEIGVTDGLAIHLGSETVSA